MIDILALLEQLYQGQSLSQQQAKDAISQVVKGNVDPIVLSSLLTSLKIKNESPEEIAGAAQALIENATAFPTPDYEFADIVGTGGDGHDTINISSSAAIVSAACGVKVAKHGNRSVSSKSGSADLFSAFGVNLTMPPEIARQSLDHSNLCFLFAPVYHAGIRHAMDVRTTLKTRTLFNLLGPLANPAKPSHLMIGVYHPDLLAPFAKTLQLLGYQKALVVHGSGLDEFSLHGPTQVYEIDGQSIHQYQVQPEDFGVARYPLEAIKGGEPEQNLQFTKQVLIGQGEPAHQGAIAINSAALLTLTGKSKSLKEGAQMAIDCMKSGSGLSTIELAAQISQGDAHG